MADNAKRLQELLDKQDIYEPSAIDIHMGKEKFYTGTVEEFFDSEWEGFKEFTASQHHLCNHLSQVDGDKAVAETYQFSLYWKKPGTEPTRNVFNSNRYVDRFEKRDGEWRIIHRQLIRNFSYSILPVNFPTAENGWPSLSQSREDPGYQTVNDPPSYFTIKN